MLCQVIFHSLQKVVRVPKHSSHYNYVKGIIKTLVVNFWQIGTKSMLGNIGRLTISTKEIKAKQTKGWQIHLCQIDQCCNRKIFTIQLTHNQLS